MSFLTDIGFEQVGSQYAGLTGDDPRLPYSGFELNVDPSTLPTSGSGTISKDQIGGIAFKLPYDRGGLFYIAGNPLPFYNGGGDLLYGDAAINEFSAANANAKAEAYYARTQSTKKGGFWKTLFSDPGAAVQQVVNTVKTNPVRALADVATFGTAEALPAISKAVTGKSISVDQLVKTAEKHPGAAVAATVATAGGQPQAGAQLAATAVAQDVLASSPASIPAPNGGTTAPAPGQPTQIVGGYPRLPVYALGGQQPSAPAPQASIDAPVGIAIAISVVSLLAFLL